MAHAPWDKVCVIICGSANVLRTLRSPGVLIVSILCVLIVGRGIQLNKLLNVRLRAPAVLAEIVIGQGHDESRASRKGGPIAMSTVLLPLQIPLNLNEPP